MERNKKGYGYLEKNEKAGKWTCKIPVGKLKSGKTRYKTQSDFSSKEEAEEWARNFVDERGTSFECPQNYFKFDEMLQEYLEYKKSCIDTIEPDKNPIKARTYDSIETTVRVYLRLEPSVQNSKSQKYHSNNALSKKYAIDITTDMIKAFLKDLILQGMSRSCVKKCYDTIKNTFAMHSELTNPCAFKFFYNRDYRADPPVCFNDDEVERICEGLHHEYVGICGPAIKFIAYTALRANEMCAIRFNDYDEKLNELHIQRNITYSRVEKKRKDSTTKTPRGNRIIVPCAKAKEALMAAMEMNKHLKTKNGYIFASSTGAPVDSSNLYRCLKSCMKRMSIPTGKNRGLHAFRHSYISKVLSQPGVGVEQVSLLAGHSSSAITSKIYSHAINTQVAHNIANIIDENERKKHE